MTAAQEFRRDYYCRRRRVQWPCSWPSDDEDIDVGDDGLVGPVDRRRHRAEASRQRAVSR